MMEALLSPKTSILIRDTQYNIPEDGILQTLLKIQVILGDIEAETYSGKSDFLASRLYDMIR
jgi:hypothetical protein